MGKKSGAKKNKTEEVKKHHVKEEKPTKSHVHAAAHSFNAKQKIKGAILFLTGLALLAVVGVLMYFKLEPTPISKLLPQDKTLGFIEMNIGNVQMTEAQELLKKHETYSPERLKALMYDITGINFDDTGFVGEKMGVGFVQLENNFAVPVVFVSINDQGDAVSFLQNLALKEKDDAFLCKDIEGFDICGYKISYNVGITFLGDYMIISPSKTALLSVLTDEGKVSQTRKFIQIRDNLPARHLAFLYVDAEVALRSFLENKNFVAKKGYELSALAPFLQIFKSHGMVLIAQENNLAMQTYTYLDKNKLDTNKFLTFSKKYQANLTKYIDSKPIAFFGGHNVTQQLVRLSQIISGDTKAAELLLDGVLKAQVKKFFGNDVSLEDDIYPLIKNEYAIVAEGDKANPEYKFILELNDDDDKEKVVDLLGKFIEINAVFEPKVIETKLPDGTTSKEIVASEEEVSESSEEYKGSKITSMKIGEQDWGIHYTFFDNVVVFASSKDSVKRGVDLYKDPSKSIKESYVFGALFEPIIRSNDEISFMNVEFLMNKLGLGEDYKQYLDPISTVISGKNYFDDGISTTHYILVK